MVKRKSLKDRIKPSSQVHHNEPTTAKELEELRIKLQRDLVEVEMTIKNFNKVADFSSISDKDIKTIRVLSSKLAKKQDYSKSEQNALHQIRSNLAKITDHLDKHGKKIEVEVHEIIKNYKSVIENTSLAENIRGDAVKEASAILKSFGHKTDDIGLDDLHKSGEALDRSIEKLKHEKKTTTYGKLRQDSNLSVRTSEEMRDLDKTKIGGRSAWDALSHGHKQDHNSILHGAAHLGMQSLGLGQLDQQLDLSGRALSLAKYGFAKIPQFQVSRGKISFGHRGGNSDIGKFTDNPERLTQEQLDALDPNRPHNESQASPTGADNTGAKGQSGNTTGDTQATNSSSTTTKRRKRKNDNDTSDIRILVDELAKHFKVTNQKLDELVNLQKSSNNHKSSEKHEERNQQHKENAKSPAIKQRESHAFGPGNVPHGNQGPESEDHIKERVRAMMQGASGNNSNASKANLLSGVSAKLLGAVKGPGGNGGEKGLWDTIKDTALETLGMGTAGRVAGSVAAGVIGAPATAVLGGGAVLAGAGYLATKDKRRRYDENDQKLNKQLDETDSELKKATGSGDIEKIKKLREQRDKIKENLSQNKGDFANDTADSVVPFSSSETGLDMSNPKHIQSEIDDQLAHIKVLNQDPEKNKQALKRIFKAREANLETLKNLKGPDVTSTNSFEPIGETKQDPTNSSQAMPVTAFPPTLPETKGADDVNQATVQPILPIDTQVNSTGPATTAPTSQARSSRGYFDGTDEQARQKLAKLSADELRHITAADIATPKNLRTNNEGGATWDKRSDGERMAIANHLGITDRSGEKVFKEPSLQRPSQSGFSRVSPELAEAAKEAKQHPELHIHIPVDEDGNLDYSKLTPEQLRRARDGARQLRGMMDGSIPLPQTERNSVPDRDNLDDLVPDDEEHSEGMVQKTGFRGGANIHLASAGDGTPDFSAKNYGSDNRLVSAQASNPRATVNKRPEGSNNSIPPDSVDEDYDVQDENAQQERLDLLEEQYHAYEAAQKGNLPPARALRKRIEKLKAKKFKHYAGIPQGTTAASGPTMAPGTVGRSENVQAGIEAGNEERYAPGGTASQPGYSQPSSSSSGNASLARRSSRVRAEAADSGGTTGGAKLPEGFTNSTTPATSGAWPSDTAKTVPDTSPALPEVPLDSSVPTLGAAGQALAQAPTDVPTLSPSNTATTLETGTSPTLNTGIDAPSVTSFAPSMPTPATAIAPNSAMSMEPSFSGAIMPGTATSTPITSNTAISGGTTSGGPVAIDNGSVYRKMPSQNVSDAMEKAATDLGVDPRVVWAKGAVESSYNPNAKAGSSSATGLGQIISGTWREIAKDPRAAQYGINGNDLSGRNDPYKSAVASMIYSDNNIKGLKKQGLISDQQLEQNPGLRYIPHNLGPDGAARFLKGYNNNPDRPVTDSLKAKEITNNPGIYTKNGRALTYGEAVKNIESGPFGQGYRLREKLGADGKLSPVGGGKPDDTNSEATNPDSQVKPVATGPNDKFPSMAAGTDGASGDLGNDNRTGMTGAKIDGTPTADNLASAPTQQSKATFDTSPTAYGDATPTTDATATNSAATASTVGSPDNADLGKERFDITGSAKRNDISRVNPALVNAGREASKYLPQGYRVELNSGFRPGDSREHGHGNASDFTIYDDKGTKLENYQTKGNFRTYEQFAQNAKAAMEQQSPGDAKNLRWGGYFGGKQGPGGTYGANDLMHLDLAGNRLGTAAGNWKDGLNSKYRGIFDDPKHPSQGMGNNYKLPDLKAGAAQQAMQPAKGPAQHVTAAEAGMALPQADTNSSASVGPSSDISEAQAKAGDSNSSGGSGGGGEGSGGGDSVTPSKAPSSAAPTASETTPTLGGTKGANNWTVGGDGFRNQALGTSGYVTGPTGNSFSSSIPSDATASTDVTSNTVAPNSASTSTAPGQGIDATANSPRPVAPTGASNVATNTRGVDFMADQGRTTSSKGDAPDPDAVAQQDVVPNSASTSTAPGQGVDATAAQGRTTTSKGDASPGTSSGDNVKPNSADTNSAVGQGVDATANQGRTTESKGEAKPADIPNDVRTTVVEGAAQATKEAQASKSKDSEENNSKPAKSEAKVQKASAKSSDDDEKPAKKSSSSNSAAASSGGGGGGSFEKASSGGEGGGGSEGGGEGGGKSGGSGESGGDPLSNIVNSILGKDNPISKMLSSISGMMGGGGGLGGMMGGLMGGKGGLNSMLGGGKGGLAGLMGGAGGKGGIGKMLNDALGGGGGKSGGGGGEGGGGAGDKASGNDAQAQDPQSDDAQLDDKNVNYGDTNSSTAQDANAQDPTKSDDAQLNDGNVDYSEDAQLGDTQPDFNDTNSSTLQDSSADPEMQLGGEDDSSDNSDATSAGQSIDAGGDTAGDATGGDEGGGGDDDGGGESESSGGDEDVNSAITSSDDFDIGQVGGEDDSSDTQSAGDTNSGTMSNGSSDDQSLDDSSVSYDKMDGSSAQTSAHQDNTATDPASKAVPDSTETQSVSPQNKGGGQSDNDSAMRPLPANTITNNNNNNNNTGYHEGKEDRSARINDSDLQIFAYKMFQA